MITRFVLGVLVWLFVADLCYPQEPKLQLKEGDTVVLLGSTFLERDRHYGQIETMLRSRFPGLKFRVRNLAWPGDTTTVQLRPLNFQNLDALLAELKPTYVVVCFGSNEAFVGPEGVEGFLRGYRGYLDRLSKTGAKLILLSPVRLENLGQLLPDPSVQNEALRLYVDATRKLAAERGCLFINLFTTVVRPSSGAPASPLTENGLHLTEKGYEVAAEAIARQLVLGPSRISPDQREKVRAAVVRKELLFFHHWRAHNAEYIYGRRAKAGDGNAGNPHFPAELAEFARLLRAADANIAQLSTVR